MAKKLVCVLLVLLAAFSGAVYWYLHGFNSNANLATGALVHFTIKDGMTTRDIAALLHEEKAVRSPELFLLTAKLTHKESMLKAGNYEITAGMSDAEIIDIIASGKTRYNKFTVPEASSIPQIAAKLEKGKLGSAEAFQQAAIDYAPYPYMETPNPHVIYKAEGFAYPATYDLPEGATEKEILATMVKEFNRCLDEELKNQIKASGMSIRDVVNLAAMVEKEAVHEDEMPLIAGVFLNRLHKNMPIQSDTTIQYLLGHQKGDLRYDDLKVDSPYNTYLYPGLPPGPIASPSEQAIKAVLNPQKSDYLYFVADKDGYHRFTKTYEEHKAMIRAIHGDVDI